MERRVGLVAVGAAALGLCATLLPRGTPGDRITLALLGLAWVFATDLRIAAAAGLLAVGVHAALRRDRLAPSRGLMRATLGLVGLLVAGRLVLEALALGWLAANRPEGARLGLSLIRSFPIVPALAFGAGLAWLAAERSRIARPVLAVALILAVTAQLVIGTPGLGREISLAQSGGAVTAMYAFIVTAGLLGVLINLGMRALERRALAWHSSVRGEVAV